MTHQINFLMRLTLASSALIAFALLMVVPEDQPDWGMINRDHSLDI